MGRVCVELLPVLIEEIDEEGRSDDGGDDADGQFCGREEASGRQVAEHEENSAGEQ